MHCFERFHATYLDQQPQVHVQRLGLGTANLTVPLVIDINTLRRENNPSISEINIFRVENSDSDKCETPMVKPEPHAINILIRKFCTFSTKNHNFSLNSTFTVTGLFDSSIQITNFTYFYHISSLKSQRTNLQTERLLPSSRPEKERTRATNRNFDVAVKGG